MPTTIAVAHYPEGAGHATRMLAIANALEQHGVEVLMAGGGVGTEFVTLNGYDAFEPTTVDYIDTYQGGSMGRVVTESLPASADRVADYVDWLRDTDPDALVTDDMFAAIAASRVAVPLYVLKHDMPGLYQDTLERIGASVHTKFQLGTAREFFYPSVCPPSDIDPAGATRVPPVALDGDEHEIDTADVVCVPSYYSEFDRITVNLERQGYDVLNVGSDDWDPVPSLLPYIRGADVVVCSGYSTIMDAAVAGTPCVISPATDEQKAVAEWIVGSDAPGFTVAQDALGILDAVDSPPVSPSYENGAARIAETVVDDLAEPMRQESPSITGEVVQRISESVSIPGPAEGTALLRSHLLGRPKSDIGVSLSAVWVAILVAQQVAARNSYTVIEHSLPTYNISVGVPFLVGVVLLVGLAAMSARKVLVSFRRYSSPVAR